MLRGCFLGRCESMGGPGRALAHAGAAGEFRRALEPKRRSSWLGPLDLRRAMVWLGGPPYCAAAASAWTARLGLTRSAKSS